MNNKRSALARMVSFCGEYSYIVVFFVIFAIYAFVSSGLTWSDECISPFCGDRDHWDRNGNGLPDRGDRPVGGRNACAGRRIFCYDL